VIYHLASWLLRPLYPFYVSHQIYHPVPNYVGTGWRLLRKKRNAALAESVIADCVASKRPMWLLPMQMEVDYQLRAYSRFPGMTAVIDETLGSFARSAPAEDLMIVKIHPLDPGLRPWRRIVRNIAKRHGLEDRVVFIDGGNLEAILAVVRGVVTVNSTVGLTALMLGTPVIALGQAVYDVAGLTFQGQLDAFWHEFAPPDRKLFDAYIRAMTDTILVRGTYYADPGMSAAVTAAADRLLAPVADHIKARLLAASARLPMVAVAAGAAD
jgi:capsular polysaccharide export protein